MNKTILIRALCVSLFCGMAILAMSLFRKMPPDSEMISFFKQREVVFICLKDMLSAEQPEVIGLTRKGVIFKEPWKRVSYLHVGMPEERFNLYQRLMSDNDVRQVLRYNGEVAILAGFSGWGFASKGPRVSYVYRASMPPNKVETLDGIKRSDSEDVAYRPIGNNWFIRLLF